MSFLLLDIMNLGTLLHLLCHDVSIKPVLQRLTGENLQYAMVNVEDEACLDVSAWGFEVVDIKEFLM